MKLPTDLIHKLQSDYIAAKYRDGTPSFINVDDETLSLIVESFIKWAEIKELVDENNMMDISAMKEW